MMFLKYRYRLGYETLCREVGDSISWQRFCRIGRRAGAAPDHADEDSPRRCGDAAVAGLNEALLAKAVEAEAGADGKSPRRHHRGGGRRWATRPTRVCWLRPSATIASTVARIQAAGGATRTRVRDRRRAAGRRARSIAAKLRLRGAAAREQAQAAVLRITGELAGLAEPASARRRTRCCATPAAPCARATGRAQGPAAPRDQRTGHACIATHPAGGGPDPQPTGRREARLGDPAGQPARPRRPPDRQGPARQAGGVRLQGPGRRQRRRRRPRPHRRGRQPGGRAAIGPAIERITSRTGRAPTAVTADRGYGDAAVERRTARPRRAHRGDPRVPENPAPPAARRTPPAFRDLVKWRTGCEGRISHLKHRYGWDRTRLDRLTGARIWCGHGVFAHNLVKISAWRKNVKYGDSPSIALTRQPADRGADDRPCKVKTMIVGVDCGRDRRHLRPGLDAVAWRSA